jgi:glycine/D-amino acid oxidase-like deaminating enzyme
MSDLTFWPFVAAPDADRSFWLQEIKAAPATPPLEEKITADVVIIGGGYTGLWTALRLIEQEPECRIVVLEADLCGSGASGRNGGQVHSWFAEIDALARVTGEAEALLLCQDTVNVIAELRQLQESGTVDMNLRLDGWLWTASSIAQEGAWDCPFEKTVALGQDRFTVLSANEILARTGSSASYMGIMEQQAGTVQPAKLAAGLRALAIARGVRIHERSSTTAITPGEVCRVKTASGGQVQARKVVLATNAWASAIPELRRHMYVVESQVIATAEVPGRLEALGWRGGASICDSQRNVLYYQRTDAGRVIFGRGSGGLAFRGRFGADFNRSPERGFHNRRELHRVYPQLRDVPVEYDWAGPIDCVPEHVPVFGALSDRPNILFGIGFNGTGIAQTPVGARILASLVLERKDRWSQSGLVGLARRKTLPPEPFRTLGGRLLRHAVRRQNDAEILNRRPDLFSRVAMRFLPGAGEH